MKEKRGFTIIELIASMAILSILAMAALPLAELSMRRLKERELRQALWEIRSAIDAYKQAAEEGKIARSATDSGYPPSLAALLEVRDISAANGDRALRFLRRIPRDPFFPDPSKPPEATWGIRSYASPANAPQPGTDVYDVYSLAAGTGINGTPYRDL
jgi:general secretion pathway protein G